MKWKSRWPQNLSMPAKFLWIPRLWCRIDCLQMDGISLSLVFSVLKSGLLVVRPREIILQIQCRQTLCILRTKFYTFPKLMILKWTTTGHQRTPRSPRASLGWRFPSWKVFYERPARLDNYGSLPDPHLLTNFTTRHFETCMAPEPRREIIHRAKSGREIETNNFKTAKIGAQFASLLQTGCKNAARGLL